MQQWLCQLDLDLSELELLKSQLSPDDSDHKSISDMDVDIRLVEVLALSLRADAHAQYEIRAFAEAMLDTVSAWVPVAHQAFLDYRLGAVTLSAQMLAVVRRMLAGEAVEQANSGLNRREWTELMAALEGG